MIVSMATREQLSGRKLLAVLTAQTAVIEEQATRLG